LICETGDVLEVAILHQELSLGTVCRSEKADGDNECREEFMEVHGKFKVGILIVEVFAKCADFIANY
jgi:hypothetical protein